MTTFTAATALVSELGSKDDVAVDMSCQDFAAPWIKEQLNRSGSGVCHPLSTIPNTYPGEPVRLWLHAEISSLFDQCVSNNI